MNSGRLNSGDAAISSATLIRRTASVHCADMIVSAGPAPRATLRGSAQQNSLNNSLLVACCAGSHRRGRSPFGISGLGIASQAAGYALLSATGTVSSCSPTTRSRSLSGLWMRYCGCPSASARSAVMCHSPVQTRPGNLFSERETNSPVVNQ